MQRLFRAVPAILAIAGLSLLPLGCGGGDDPVEPPADECSIGISHPAPGTKLLGGEAVSLRWDAAGGGRVRVVLLRGGAEQGEISGATDNDGYFGWTASTFGGPSGDDFAIAIAALDDGACADTLGPVEIIDSANCGIVPLVRVVRVDAGDDLLVEWTSGNTSGEVDIDLYYGPLEGALVGPIAAGTPDDGEFLWENVDSFHRGTGDQYYLRMADSRVATCWATTAGNFTIVDEDICWIVVQTPTRHSIHNEGTTVDIEFTAARTSGQVDLRLYAGSGTPLDIIAQRVSIADPVVRWTVAVDDGYTGVDNMYRVLVFDSEDSYCRGFSPQFSIVRTP